MSVVVLVTDHNYFYKARRTIIDVRTRGNWKGDIVLITVDYNASNDFLTFYNVTSFPVQHIDTSYLLAQYQQCPIRPTDDDRQYLKLVQWDKFYVFHTFFRKWKKVIYLDAGLRVLDDICYLDEIPCYHTLLAPDDAAPNDHVKRFGGIIEIDKNEAAVSRLFQKYNPGILYERYFLNCVWIYDTSLITDYLLDDLILEMNQFPICRCNEMTIMNLIFTFQRRVWKPFPEFTSSGKRLFGWTENDVGRGGNGELSWKDYCLIKYPYTLSFEI
jgi:hypothetical protein